MSLQETIKKDLALAMKARDEERKSAIRVIMGEFGRMEQKDLSDDQVVQILKKLIKSEKETLEIKGATEDSEFIRIVEGYLPKKLADEEIEAWIRANIDFAGYKDKMQAMRDIMRHFGSAADGNVVKRILQNM